MNDTKKVQPIHIVTVYSAVVLSVLGLAFSVMIPRMSAELQQSLLDGNIARFSMGVVLIVTLLVMVGVMFYLLKQTYDTAKLGSE